MPAILIVDDHPAFRLVIKTHLQQMPRVDLVVEADSGQVEVELARQYVPAVVVPDPDILRINSLDIIPRLELIVPEVRVLILYGQDPTAVVSRATRARMRSSARCCAYSHAVEAVLAGYTVFPMTRRCPARNL